MDAVKTEDILQIAEQYDVITFDVFDTLIIRDVRRPVDVFRLAYGGAGRYFRSLAELTAKKLSPYDEISLSEIERYCPFSCSPEIQMEYQLCRANPELFALYSRLHQQGKKIYAISDMYLDRHTIAGILKKAGYEMPVFVSSEYRCNKCSGKLFHVFLQKMHYQPSQVLHIGDNPEADIQGAEKAGIRAVRTATHAPAAGYVKYRLSSCELTAFLDHGMYGIQNSAERLGYEILGPLVLSFCQWVHEQYQKEQFDRLYFLARDMHFIYEIYQSVYSDDAHYLHISRKSLQNARTSPGQLMQYLKKENCFGNAALVDTGWVGTAQAEIAKYAAKMDVHSDIGGLYMGTKLAYRFRPHSRRSHSCFYASVPEQARAAILSSFLEALIGSNEKQVISYQDGSPVYDCRTVLQGANLLQDGARRFVRDWVDIKQNRPISPKTARQSFEHLFYCPAPEDMQVLGGLHYEDFKDTAILSYREGFPYWRHLHQWLSDLEDSAWKGAYLKKSGILYPLLLAVYGLAGAGRIFAVDLARCRKDEI